jgi:hypothetical protein
MGRRQIEVGGGGPAWTASGVILPKDGEAGTLPLSLALKQDEEAMNAGRGVRALVGDAIRAGERGIRDLGRLVFEFPAIVYRLPEFSDYMDHLVGRGEDSAVTRVLGDTSRGRPRERVFYVVGLVDAVLARDGGSIARAATWVAEHHRELLKSAASIQNDYSRYKHIYDIYRSSRYVPEGELTPRRWRRPKT